MVSHIEAASISGASSWTTKHVGDCNCCENCSIERGNLDPVLGKRSYFEYVLAALPALLPDYATVEGSYHPNFPAIYVQW